MATSRMLSRYYHSQPSISRSLRRSRRLCERLCLSSMRVLSSLLPCYILPAAFFFQTKRFFSSSFKACIFPYLALRNQQRILCPAAIMTTALISHLRVDYTANGALDEKTLPPRPIPLFKAWLQDAVSANVREPNAMCLATSSLSGQPSARFVLMKGLDEEGTGFIFYTNLHSRKARELSENPKCALTFWWAVLERSVRIEGTIERIDEEEEFRYFNSRPWGSRVGAWVSRQSEVIEGREILEMRSEEMKRRFGGGEGKEENETNGSAGGALEKPPFWGGFKVKAKRIEFWKGRESRLHDRIVYEKQEGGNKEDTAWTMKRLQP